MAIGPVTTAKTSDAGRATRIIDVGDLFERYRVVRVALAATVRYCNWRAAADDGISRIERFAMVPEAIDA